METIMVWPDKMVSLLSYDLNQLLILQLLGSV